MYITSSNTMFKYQRTQWCGIVLHTEYRVYCIVGVLIRSLGKNLIGQFRGFGNQLIIKIICLNYYI